MPNQILRVCVGATLGVLCKFACDRLIGLLLKKRGRELTESKGERIGLFAVMALLGVLIAILVPFSPETVFFFLLLIICEAVALIDAHTRLIPNDLILAIFALSAIFGIPGLFGLSGWPEWKPLSALLGMLACTVIFALPAVLSKQVGAGDIKLAAAMGFCMGLSNSLFAIIIMGAFVIIYTFLQSKMPILKFMASTIPMGPFLALSMIAVLLAAKLPTVSEYLSVIPF